MGGLVAQELSMPLGIELPYLRSCFMPIEISASFTAAPLSLIWILMQVQVGSAVWQDAALFVRQRGPHCHGAGNMSLDADISTVKPLL